MPTSSSSTPISLSPALSAASPNAIVVPYEVSSLMGLAASFKEILTENTNSGAKKDEVKPTPVKKGQEYKMNINDLNPAKTRKTEK